MWSDFPRSRAHELVSEMAERDPVTPGSWFQFGVESKADQILIGDLAFKVDASEPRQAEIGYSFHPDFQGRGLATEAVTGLLNYGFRDCGLHRIYATTDPENEASIRLLKRARFTQEAHFRENLWFKGRWADDIVFAILEREFLQS